MSKRDELREMLKRRIESGLAELCFKMQDREVAEVVRRNVGYFSNGLAWHLTEQYAVLELFDIMEWKRTRVRR